MSFKKMLAAFMTAGMMLSLIPMTSMADSTGWRKVKDGWKYYTAEDGFVRDTWMKIDGKWYYFLDGGLMAEGIDNFFIDGTYYDFASNGVCKNPQGEGPSKGWYKITVNSFMNFLYSAWFYYDENLEPYTGVHQIGGKWYYFDDDKTYQFPAGSMYTNAFCSLDMDHMCFYKSDGERLTGWYKLDVDYGSGWIYADSSGALKQNEWLYSGGNWYYFGDNLDMLADVEDVKINGVLYSFDKNGVCINPDGKKADKNTGWQKVLGDYYTTEYYYNDENGNRVNGWYKIDNKWYFFDPIANGRMRTGFLYLSGERYFLKPNGEMLTGWYEYTDAAANTTQWIYAESNGKIYASKWLNSNGKWYYFDWQGYMISDVANLLIKDTYYSFDKNGVCTNPYAKPSTQKGWVYLVDSNDFFHGWVYYGDDGKLYREKWLNYNGQWYYFGAEGDMCIDCTIYLDGKYYDFDENGVCINPYTPREHDKSYGDENDY